MEKNAKPNRRAQAKKILEDRGQTMADETPDYRAGLLDENTEIQDRIAEVEKRRRERGSLGDRFKAWEKSAQAKGATNAAAKLADASVTRLEAEEEITEEVEKQTKEKRDQLRLEQGGQGKFALMAFNGVGSVAKAEPGGAAATQKPLTKAAEKGVIAAALAETGGPVAMAASSEQEVAPAPPPMLARNAPQAQPAGNPAFGSKEFFDGLIFGGGTEQPSGGHSMLPNYMSKIPQGDPNWKSKQLDPDRTRGYKSKIPQGEPAYVAKMEGGAGSGAGTAPPTDMTKTNQLLESINNALKGGVVGRLA